LLQIVVQTPDKLPLVNKAHIIVNVTEAKSNSETAYKAPHFTPAPEEETFYEVIEEEAEEINLKDGSNNFRPIFKEEPFDETQKLIVENIASNDYFVFDKALSDRNQMGEELHTIKPEIVEEPVIPAPLSTPIQQDTPEVVTRYHDDKMPYSFMWWLDKTRNKHSSVYQPFASAVPQKAPVQPGADTFVNNALDDKTQEEDIIERFIQDEPQMRTPSGDKLDSENKAKQSAQDHEELITETLASIYADQMLFSKAIAAYKILILKNPEKRRYFASQIESLEKKIN